MMADLETAVYTYLAALANVNTMTAGQIYPDVAPEGVIALPRVTFVVITDPPVHHMQGASGLSEATVQIDVWAASSVDRRKLANYIKNGMDGIIGGTMGGLAVNSVILKNRQNTFENPPDGSETGIFRQRMEFTVWYVESIPTLN